MHCRLTITKRVFRSFVNDSIGNRQFLCASVVNQLEKVHEAVAPDMVNVKPDSILLVVEGCADEGQRCGRFYYLFNSDVFALFHFDPDPPDQPAK